MYLILRDFSDGYSDKAIQYFIEEDGISCLSYFDEERIVVDEDEINFDEHVLRYVTYIKGVVLKMFSDIVGEVNFFKVCSNWLNTFKNKNGEVDEFITVANNTLNKDYSDFFNTWLKVVGLPVLNVVELFDKDDKVTGIKISQESLSGSIYQFKIPILYEVDGQIKKMDAQMNENEKVIEIEYDWIVVNDEMGSLCAVNYSKELL
ncbi:hypothetical protein M9Y10_031670 [Tritrichomonas musculus]|uniref:Peptidase M1 membrane alanine aminopeptidase domain-containing protein n=1 Tax=Tritrichomonas musculus TaxID=1915356 RepID=A0ABR2H1C6_9EUKA